MKSEVSPSESELMAGLLGDGSPSMSDWLELLRACQMIVSGCSFVPLRSIHVRLDLDLCQGVAISFATSATLQTAFI